MSVAAATGNGTRRLLVRRSETSDQHLLEANLTPLSATIELVNGVLRTSDQRQSI